MQSEIIESVRALAEARGEFDASTFGTHRHCLAEVAYEGALSVMNFPALLAALERAERIEALLKRGTQAGISNYPNQFVHFSYEDGQEIAALLSEPQ